MAQTASEQSAIVTEDGRLPLELSRRRFSSETPAGQQIDNREGVPLIRVEARNADGGRDGTNWMLRPPKLCL
jgi:hypothetical protein